MMKISKRSITEEMAAKNTIEKLSKKKFFGLGKALDIEYVNIDDIEIFYAPFYVAMTENVIKSKFFKNSGYRIMFAVEGYTGEVGITVGTPQFTEVDANSIENAQIIDPRICVDEAKSKIVDCAAAYVMRKNRRIPDTKINFIDIIWKPTYMIPVVYNDEGVLKTMRRFVDAESGYNVYRYDLIWEKMLKSIA